MVFDSSLTWLKGAWETSSSTRWLVFILPVAYMIYKIATWNFGVFKRCGINGPRPWPLVGTTKLLIRMGLGEHDLALKKLYGPVVGIFVGHQPCMLVYDLDIIKAILVKDFHNFRNRKMPLIPDYPFEKFVHVLLDDHWRHVRNTMTPAFSTGKLRRMQQQIEKCAETLIQNLQMKADANVTFDFHDYCGAYTMDVIASTAFGIQIDSHNDPNNLFIQMCNRVSTFKLGERRAILTFFFPFLIKPLNKIGFRLFPKEVIDFFVEVVNNAVELRKSQADGSIQTDLLQLVVNAEIDPTDADDDDDESAAVTDSSTADGSGNWKASRKGLTRDEIIAQGMLFILAGYDTVANALSLLGYLLAVNSDCQEKLIAEIDDVMQGREHVTYELIKEMPYLDMCISETLRMYPPAPRTDRVAQADVTINGVFIPKGMHIEIPIYGIHNDPEYWPNPEKFDPDRFLPEAKAARNQYCYLPFGMGPHNCIGNRLGLLEMKMAVVHILRSFRLVVSDETQIPLQLEKLRVRGTDGVKLRIQPRK